MVESKAARKMAVAWASEHAPRGSLLHAALVGQKLGRGVPMPPPWGPAAVQVGLNRRTLLIVPRADTQP